MWALYLAYCEAGFAERRIRDMQLVLAKQRTGLEALGSGRIPGSGERHEPLLAGQTG